MCFSSGRHLLSTSPIFSFGDFFELSFLSCDGVSSQNFSVSVWISSGSKEGVIVSDTISESGFKEFSSQAGTVPIYVVSSFIGGICTASSHVIFSETEISGNES